MYPQQSLQMIQNWQEWIHKMSLLLFRETEEMGGEMDLLVPHLVK